MVIYWFIIYINDIPEVCKNLCSIILYADDAKLDKHVLQDEDHPDLQMAIDSIQDTYAGTYREKSVKPIINHIIYFRQSVNDRFKPLLYYIKPHITPKNYQLITYTQRQQTFLLPTKLSRSECHVTFVCIQRMCVCAS